MQQLLKELLIWAALTEDLQSLYLRTRNIRYLILSSIFPASIYLLQLWMTLRRRISLRHIGAQLRMGMQARPLAPQITNGITLCSTVSHLEIPVYALSSVLC